MSKLIDLTGQRFSKLVVIAKDDTRKGITYWKCKCDCGNETTVTSQHLRGNRTKSCGCGRLGTRRENIFDFSKGYGVCTIDDGTQFLFDKEDYEKIRKLHWYKDKDGYLRGSIRGKLIFLHKFIMDCPEGMIVDHINRNPQDNRKQNLRICTPQQNVWNRKFKGYTKVKDKYRVTLWKDGKLVFRELCDTEDKAKEVRRKAELLYFGEYAYKEVANE